MLWPLLLLIACAGDPPAAAQAPAVPAPPPEEAPPAETWPGEAADYSAWMGPEGEYLPLWKVAPAPEGYHRPPVDGYAAWLRALPMRPAGTPVKSYRGDTIWSGDDSRILGVVALDVGGADLQQCADTILRLRLEWLWHMQADEIAFRFTSGHLSRWSEWAAGSRPVISGSKVSWKAGGRRGADRANFVSWYQNLFTYAGTQSLAKEGVAVPAAEVRGGDFVVQGGSPGHALVILDAAVNEAGAIVVLVGEGYMPAQDLHVFNGPVGGWYPVGEALKVPTWEPFLWSGLRRFQP